MMDQVSCDRQIGFSAAARGVKTFAGRAFPSVNLWAALVSAAGREQHFPDKQRGASRRPGQFTQSHRGTASQTSRTGCGESRADIAQAGPGCEVLLAF